MKIWIIALLGIVLLFACSIDPDLPRVEQDGGIETSQEVVEPEISSIEPESVEEDVVSSIEPVVNSTEFREEESTEAVLVIIQGGFTPKQVKISVGQTVTWKNDDSKAAKISSTLGKFFSDRMLPGDEFSHTFDKTGTFPYIDATFKSRSGTIIVTAME